MAGKFLPIKKGPPCEGGPWDKGVEVAWSVADQGQHDDRHEDDHQDGDGPVDPHHDVGLPGVYGRKKGLPREP
jgi:hypothetical protein